MLVDNLQSYAKCSECNSVIWCEISKHDQACGCICGGVRLENALVVGTTFDPDFSNADMEAILQAE